MNAHYCRSTRWAHLSQRVESIKYYFVFHVSDIAGIFYPTSSRKMAGCFSVWMTVFAAPSTVWAANWSAICRGTPCLTAPSAMASITVKICGKGARKIQRFSNPSNRNWNWRVQSRNTYISWTATWNEQKRRLLFELDNHEGIDRRIPDNPEMELIIFSGTCCAIPNEFKIRCIFSKSCVVT